MMRQRLAVRADEERGFTIIELLVVTIIIGVLAAIALAVFLNQADKGNDANTKSDVNNVARLIQACSAGSDESADFRNCSDNATVHPQSIKLDSAAPALPTAPGGDCGDAASATVDPDSDVRIFEEGETCFTVVGISASGNKFWYIKHNDGSVSRDCAQRNNLGCPSDGDWAG